MTRLPAGRPARRASFVLLALTALLLAGCERLAGVSQYGSVSVATVDRDGQPLARVPLLLYTGQRPLVFAESDARGRYLFEQVPPGTYGVQATAPEGYYDPDEKPFVFLDRLDVEPNSIEPARITFDRCIGTLAVRVSDENATTAAGVSVKIYNGAGETVQIVKTGADGSVNVPLTCRVYGTQIVPEPGFTSTPGRGSSYTDELHVHRGSVLPVALRVKSCFGTLHIVTREASGQPVPAVSFVVYAPTGNLSLGKTDATGAVTVPRMPCGTELGVSIAAPPGYSVAAGRGSSFFDGIKMANGVTTEIAFTLARP